MALPRLGGLKRLVPSRLRDGVSKRTQRFVSAGATAAIVAGYAIAVSATEGIDRAELSLNDGGVWVTNQANRMVGHLNYPSLTIDAGVRADSGEFELFQEKDTVLVRDAEAGTLTRVDPAKVSLETPKSLGGANDVAFGGGNVAMLDAKNGKLWVSPVGDLASFDPATSETAMDDVAEGTVAVGKDGSVHAVSAKKGVWRSMVVEGATFRTEDHSLPEEIAASKNLQITAVGSQSVVLDPDSGTVALPDGQTASLGETKSLQLQQAGSSSDEVLVASATTLHKVALANGAVDSTPANPDAPTAQGSPSRPVFHQGCSYAAWTGTGRFIRDCPKSDADVREGYPTLQGSSSAEFRTNRKYIVLNDAATGNVWLPDEDMVLVNDWDEVNQNNQSDSDENDDSTDLTTQQQDPDRQQENHPPSADDDRFGVRPGRTTSLPVTNNDSDQDGDILTVTPTSAPAFGTVRQSRGGQALQIEVPEGASGTTTFTYEADDGRGGKDTATATIEAHPFGVNRPPTQQIQTTAKLSSGGKTTLQVLGDWIDPDGDPIYLQKATPGDDGLTTSFQESGSVTVEDLKLGPANRDVKLAVSDGTAAAEGVMTVEVTEGVNLPPRANADYVRVLVGDSGTVSPLGNDVDPNGEPLRLVGTGPAPDGLAMKAAPNLGNITVSADQPGTRYLTYFVSDGPMTSTGVIRVDAVESNTQAPPVVEDDIGMLASGSQTLVPVLSNDTDQGGGVLTLQSVGVPEGSPLVVSPVNHEIVRVTAPGGLSQPQEFTYTVSNGTTSAVGRGLVIPVAAPDSRTGPQLVDDQLTVRAGDVGSVNVLANDRSPNKLPLKVRSDLQYSVDPEMGEPFLSDNVVRFRAGKKSGTTRIVYTVEDSLGNSTSASVNVTVVPVDEEKNTAPNPVNVTSRAIVGQPLSIPIQLDGIDAEGDSVELVGLGDSPRLGAAEVGVAAIKYTPSKSGTDSFTYTVRDAYGKMSLARVRIGVAPQATANQAPIATRDQVLVRPGTKVVAQVTENDIDPDGDPITLVDGSVSSPSKEMRLEQRGGQGIVVTTPTKPGSYPVGYRIQDGRGGFAEGLLTVNVSESAPDIAPIARDDAVSRDKAFGKKTVTVDVLDNDEDKDGDILEDQVTSEDTGVTVNRNKTLTIATTEKPRIVLYTVTDPSGKKASAIVRVPGNTQSEPTVDLSKVPIDVEAGKPLTIKLDDYILTRKGRSVIVTDPALVQASAGWNGDPLVVDERTLKFKASDDFSGLTSITLEVTDGKDRNDSNGIVKRLTLPINVKASGNRPPVFTPTSVSVEAGGSKAQVNLATMTTDPDTKDDPSTFDYKVAGEVKGINTSISGSVMTVTAEANAPVGPAGSIPVTVSDGQAEVKGAVPVQVVKSTKPLVQLSEISKTIEAGVTTKIDVSEGATNPFPGMPLSVYGTPSVTSGDATVTASGGTISVTPPANSRGEVLVEYQVMDGSNDPNRAVGGTLRLAVRARPDKVSGVTAEVLDKNTAVVKWTNGSPNGSPFTKFTVRDLTDGDTTECPVGSQCVISGRSLGKNHSFEVVAHNEVGPSEPAVSGPILMDVVPNQPGAPTATAGDQTVTFSWNPATSEGSPVKHYIVSVTGAGNHTVAGTSLTLDAANGIKNGSRYSATVTAVNQQGNSAPSAPSNEVMPFGKPGAFDLTTENTTLSKPSSGDIRVTWGNVEANGSPITSYTVASSTGASKTVTDANATSAVLTGIPYSPASVTFTVTATNAAGQTSASTQTVVRGQPAAPTGGGATISGTTIVVTPPTGGVANGWTQNEITYQMSTDGGQKWTNVANMPIWEGIFVVSINFRAVGTAADGKVYPGPASNAVQLKIPRYTFTLSDQTYPCTVGACAPIGSGKGVLVEFKGYAPNQEVTCRPRGSTQYKGTFKVDSNGNAAPQLLKVGYPNGNPAVAQPGTASAELHGVWECDGFPGG